MTNVGKRLQELKKHPRDEYYTRYEDLAVLDEWDFSDMIVYSPFDSEKSAFVKYFKSHPVKEFIYTSDDAFTHEDLFEKADIVVTNPSFSRKIDLYKLCRKTKTEMILILPNIPQTVDPKDFYPFCKVTKFDSPYENNFGVCCQWFSTIGSKKHPHGWSFQEIFGRPFPIGEPYLECRGYKKYGKRSGFPPLDTKGEFIVTCDCHASEFEFIKELGLNGTLVRYRK